MDHIRASPMSDLNYLEDIQFETFELIILRWYFELRVDTGMD